MGGFGGRGPRGTVPPPVASLLLKSTSAVFYQVSHILSKHHFFVPVNSSQSASNMHNQEKMMPFMLGNKGFGAETAKLCWDYWKNGRKTYLPPCEDAGGHVRHLVREHSHNSAQ